MLWIYPNFLISHTSIKYLQRQWRMILPYAAHYSQCLPIITFFQPSNLFFLNIINVSTNSNFRVQKQLLIIKDISMMGLDFGGKLLNYWHWIFRMCERKKNWNFTNWIPPSCSFLLWKDFFLYFLFSLLPFPSFITPIIFFPPRRIKKIKF